MKRIYEPGDNPVPALRGGRRGRKKKESSAEEPMKTEGRKRKNQRKAKIPTVQTVDPGKNVWYRK